MSQYGYGFGHDEIALIKEESIYGQPDIPVAEDAVRVNSVSIAPVEERRIARDIRRTRSARERARGRRSATWSAEMYLRNGDAGIKPGAHALLKAGFGIEAVTANSSVVYMLKKGDPQSLAIWTPKENIQTHARGCVVENLTFTATMEDYVMLSASGSAKLAGQTGETQANGAGSSSTAITVDDGDMLDPYSLIQIAGISDNPVLMVSSVDKDANSAVLSSAQSWADDAKVTPAVITPQYTGDKSFDGTELYVAFVGSGGAKELYPASGFTVTLATGNTLHSDISDSSPVDVIPTSMRSVTVSVDAVVRKEHIAYFSEFNRSVNKRIELRYGPDEPGKRAILEMPVINFDPTEVVTPEEGPSTVSLTGICLATDMDEDELRLSLT